MCGVQVQDLHDKLRDGIGSDATKPSRSHGIGVNGDVLRVVIPDNAVAVRIGAAVKGSDTDEVWWSIRSLRREELVEERRSAIEQDGLGSKEEVGVLGLGVLVAVELVLSHDGLIV